MTRIALFILMFFLTAACPPAGAEELRGRPTILLVVGAEGTAEYGEQFAEWAALWREAAATADADLITIGPAGPDSDPGPDEPTDQQRLKQAVDSTSPAAPLWLVLIGHGTFDGRTAKFNLRGPDVSAEQLAEWLRPIRSPLAVINTASASGPFLPALSAPNRVVITATRSGQERNFARFGGALARSIADPEADLDKDGQTSLLEAFLLASRRVQRFYESEQRLATEHALIDDNGDGRGTPADWFRGVRPVRKPADDASPDGYRAHQLHLVRSPFEREMDPDLRDRRDQLEREVFQLRDAKEEHDEDEYYRRLEELLTELARVYKQAEEDNGE